MLFYLNQPKIIIITGESRECTFKVHALLCLQAIFEFLRALCSLMNSFNRLSPPFFALNFFHVKCYITKLYVLECSFIKPLLKHPVNVIFWVSPSCLYHLHKTKTARLCVQEKEQCDIHCFICKKNTLVFFKKKNKMSDWVTKQWRHKVQKSGVKNTKCLP